MSLKSLGPLSLTLEIQKWPLTKPFKTAAHTLRDVEVLVVKLQAGDHIGRGEAAGVYYRKETAASMAQQVERLRPDIESGITREALLALMDLGGARNALDCALWDLESKVSHRSVWDLAGLGQPQPLMTTFTCGADEPKAMAHVAKGYRGARAIKLKLTGETLDIDRVRAVREAMPDVWLSIDANEGFTPKFLEKILPALIEARVELIEQPFRRGEDALLDRIQSPIPFAADESAQGCVDVVSLVGRYSTVNIKLDKCGGLTEGLAMARAAREQGLQVMVGNMLGTSLAMAPAFLIGQLCSVVDLDGPIFLQQDHSPSVQYVDGFVSYPHSLWG
jgi:L-alanine-DL-glutamate epimerase-like enolase superfamily enzyme